MFTGKEIADALRGLPRRRFFHNIMAWMNGQLEMGFDKDEVIAGVKKAISRGVDPTMSDDLFSLDVYMNALEECTFKEWFKNT